nr:helicase associated domain-containing protein [Actinospica acidiphila]
MGPPTAESPAGRGTRTAPQEAPRRPRGGHALGARRGSLGDEAGDASLLPTGHQAPRTPPRRRLGRERDRGPRAYRSATGESPAQGRPRQEPERAETRAAQLTAIDPDWNCPWPLDWQRHYRHLTHLAADEPGGLLPDIAPGVQIDGDDLGRWLKRQTQPATWKQLSTEQQDRLTRIGVKPAQTPPLTPAAKGAAKGPSNAQQAFQRGLAALAQWVEREGAQRPVPRGHVEAVAINGQEHQHRLGVWYANQKQRRDKLGPEQLKVLRELGIQWA